MLFEQVSVVPPPLPIQNHKYLVFESGRSWNVPEVQPFFTVLLQTPFKDIIVEQVSVVPPPDPRQYHLYSSASKSPCSRVPEMQPFFTVLLQTALIGIAF